MKRLCAERIPPELFALAVAAILFGLVPVALAATYQLSGSTIRDYVKADGSHGTTSNWFRVLVADCRSRITAGAIRDPAIEYFEYRCDGTNSSLLIKYFPRPVKVANQAALMLNTGPVPNYDYGMISDVWLAYASACFYKRSTRGRTEPVFFMGTGFRENNLKVKSEWKLSTGDPPLLEHMRDFCDGYRYNEQNGILIKEKLPSPFDKGCTNATYSVLQWTNIGRLTLPSEWQVVQYKPNLENAQLEPRITTRGSTVSVETGEPDMDFAPYVPKEARVIDGTMEAQGAPIRSYAYVTQDGRLRTLAEMARDQGFKLALSSAKRVEASPGRRRMIVIIAAVLILFPAVVLLQRSWRRDSEGEM